MSRIITCRSTGGKGQGGGRRLPNHVFEAYPHPARRCGASALGTTQTASTHDLWKHLRCLASLSRKGPGTFRDAFPSLKTLVLDKPFPLTRMTVSACSVDPWALHLPPGPTWHSSYHQAKLCCVCQIHIGIYEKKNWRGRMLLTTCHIGCISPRRQARKRRTLQTAKTYFVIVV